jgi:hypothetical protein
MTWPRSAVDQPTITGRSRLARRIAYEAAIGDELAQIVDRRDGVACRERNESAPLAGEERAAADEKRCGTGRFDRLERRLEIALARDFHHRDPPFERAPGRRHVRKFRVYRRIRQIDERRDNGGRRDQIAQQFEPLRIELRASEKRHAGEIAFRPIDALDQTGFDRVFAGDEHDRNGLGSGARRFHRVDSPRQARTALKNLSRPKVEWGLICSPAH